MRIAFVLCLFSLAACTATASLEGGGGASQLQPARDGTSEAPPMNISAQQSDSTPVASPLAGADAGTVGSPGSVSKPSFGVLAANPAHLATDKAAGIQWAALEMAWADIEPARGQFDDSEIPVEIIRDYKAAGFKVELSLGFHTVTPAWAAAIEPWKDQTGKTYPETPNWFNASVQSAVAEYIRHVLAVIGPNNVDAIRIGGLADAGEINFPNIGPYVYLGYSASALSGSALIPANPVPQCRPPNCSNKDAPVFLAWYVGAVAKFGNFQVKTLRDAGYAGDVLWLLAGGGIDGQLKEALLRSGLSPSDEFPEDSGVSGAGQDWPVLLSLIDEKGPKVVISDTGINDSTADNANEASSDMLDWSQAHWVAYHARANGFTRLSAENVGLVGMQYDNAQRMQLAFSKMKELGYEKLMWARDDQLYLPGGASISDYAAAIRAATK